MFFLAAPTSLSRVLRRTCVPLTLIVGGSCAGGPPAVPTLAPGAAVGGTAMAAAGAGRLERGAVVERRLGGGETHEYRIAAQAGTYLRLLVEQSGVDVIAALSGPAGEPLATADGPGGTKEPELLSLVTSASGELRLTVGTHDPQAPPGSYAVRLEELRQAGPGDGLRVTAERTLAEARHWRAEGSVENRPKAMERAEEALRLWREAGDAVGEMAALDLVGRLQHAMGETKDAIASFEEELSLAKRTRDRRAQARALMSLGLCRNDLGDWPQSLAHHREELAIREELGDRAGRANALYNIGYNLQLLGQLDAALDSYERALELKQALKDEVGEGWTLCGVGTIYFRRGQVQQALERYDRALALSRKVGDTLLEATALDALGRFYRQSGQLQRALEAYTQALALSQAAGYQPDEAKVRYGLGSVYHSLGQTEEALAHYQAALGLHQALGNRSWETRTLLEIARVHLDAGDPAAALEPLAQALAHSREMDVREAQPTQATVLHLLGIARLAQGNPRQALVSLNEALELRRRIGNPTEEAKILLGRAAAEKALGQMEPAAADFDRALELGRQTQAAEPRMAALFGRARLDRDRGDLLAARDRMEQALQLLESVRSGVASDRLRSSFFASRRSYYGFSIDLLMDLEARHPGQGFAAAALAMSERARTRALLDLLAEGRIDVERGIAPDLKSQETEIGYRLSQVQRSLIDELSQERPDAEKIASLRRELDVIEEQREQLEWRIRHEHPRYAEVLYPAPLQLPEIKELLDDRTALLEYALGEEGSYLFVVTRDRLESHRLPKAGRLEELVRQVRTALESPGRRTLGLYRRVAWQLYAELVAPAGRAIAGKRLLIAPDGVLHHLCFEALLTEPAGALDYPDLPYLLRRHAVTYVPSASVLAGLRADRTAVPASGEPPKQLLAFGDPYRPEEATREADTASAAPPTRGPLDEEERWSMPRLEGTAREVSEIARIYPQGEVKVYVREEASEENVKHNPLLAEARRIHFATHGLLDKRRPELSGLLLARSEGSREDGVLRVYEVFNLSLSADLVVLSACETGLGKEVAGEGLVGLTRAFLYAGTPAVVVSLWRVADVATPDLMVRFYGDLDRGESTAEALRRSKLAMIEDRLHAHPYYWSAFVLVGAPEQPM